MHLHVCYAAHLHLLSPTMNKARCCRFWFRTHYIVTCRLMTMVYPLFWSPFRQTSPMAISCHPQLSASDYCLIASLIVPPCLRCFPAVPLPCRWRTSEWTCGNICIILTYVTTPCDVLLHFILSVFTPTGCQSGM